MICDFDNDCSKGLLQTAFYSNLLTDNERRVSLKNVPSACHERICVLKMTEKILIIYGGISRLPGMADPLT